MEDTLRASKPYVVVSDTKSLNPCFNGRYSQRQTIYVSLACLKSLNPCFNGRYSQSKGSELGVYKTIAS